MVVSNLMPTCCRRSPEFRKLVTDDLGFSLLALSSACSEMGSPRGNSLAGSLHILQLSLGVFGVLFSAVGPCIRLTVECFVRQVYLKALVQSFDLFNEQVLLFYILASLFNV
jgi:hypothetical protein